MSAPTAVAAWRRGSVVTLGSAMPVAGCVLVLDQLWRGGVPPDFLLGTAGGMGVVAAVLVYAVGGVARLDPPAPPIRLADWITVTRGSALALLAGFVLVESAGWGGAWLLAGLFGVAAGLDGVDGWVARRTGTVSRLGGRLDEGMDTVTVLFGTVAVVVLGLAHWLVLLAGVAKLVFQGGIVLRRWRGRPVAALDDRLLRTAVSAVLLLAIWLALLPPIGETLGRSLTALAVIPFLLHFGRDWLVVSGG